jgi:hypothetical protein
VLIDFRSQAAHALGLGGPGRSSSASTASTGSGGGRGDPSATGGRQAKVRHHNVAFGYPLAFADVEGAVSGSGRDSAGDGDSGAEGAGTTPVAIVISGATGGYGGRAAAPSVFLEVAVRALGMLVENSGWVAVPYIDHPHLLGLLLAIVSRGQSMATTGNSAASGSGSKGAVAAGGGSRGVGLGSSHAW